MNHGYQTNVIHLHVRTNPGYRVGTSQMKMASEERLIDDLMRMKPYWYDSQTLIGLDASIRSSGICYAQADATILSYHSSPITRMGPILDRLREYDGYFVMLSEYVPHMARGMAKAHQAACNAIEDDIKNILSGRVKCLRINPDVWHGAMLGCARNTASEPNRLKERSVTVANAKLGKQGLVANDDEADAINVAWYLHNQMEYYRRLRKIPPLTQG